MVRSGETSSAVAASSIVGRMPCASLVWHCICMVQVACECAQSEDTVVLCPIKIARTYVAFSYPERDVETCSCVCSCPCDAVALF